MWPWPRGKYQTSPGSKSLVSARPPGIDDGGADAALENKRPFGRGGVPVQLAHRAGLKPHRDAGDALGDRQLLNRRLLAVAVADDLAFRLLQREFESRQILARERRVRNVVHETRIAAGGRQGRRQRCQRDGSCGGQKIPPLRIGHDALLCGPAKCSTSAAHARRRSAHQATKLAMGYADHKPEAPGLPAVKPGPADARPGTGKGQLNGH